MDTLTAVTRTLAAFEARPSEPAQLQSPHADELETELAELPAPPDGDLQPDDAVSALRETWHHESQGLAADADTEPESPGAEEASRHDGASAIALQAELAALPDAPDGDLEVYPEVTNRRETWHLELQRLESHDETAPRQLPVDGLPVPTLEVRRLADELETPIPVVDSQLREAVRLRRAGPAQHVKVQGPALSEPERPKSPRSSRCAGSQS